MRICFPIRTDQGVESELYGHFASAPHFLIVDNETKACSVVANCAPDHPFAGCNPFSALKGRTLDCIVVDAICDDALRAMNLGGFRVFQAASVSVAENIALFGQGRLAELALQESAREGRCNTGGGCNCSHHHEEEP